MSSLPGPMITNLKDILSTGRHSDLTIICEGREFKVHKVILESSTVFRKMVAGPYKEGIENTDILTLNDEVDALQALIHYIYHFTYNDSFAASDLKLSFAVRVYAIADFYQVEALQGLAASKLKNTFTPSDGEDQTDFINALTLVEERSNPADPTLWNIVLPVIKANINTLLNYGNFQNFILDHPDVNIRLLSMLDGTSAPPSRAVSKGFGCLDDDDGNIEVPKDHYRHGRGQRLGGG